MENMGDLIASEVVRKKTALIVGLDPVLENFPSFLLKEKGDSAYPAIEDAIFHFNRIIIDNTADYAVAVKPQLAYYEIYGSYGIRAMEKTVQYAKSKGLIVINDGKRGDIKETSEAYARAFLGYGPMSGDMVTVNPFLGEDGYKPFIDMAKVNHKGLFILLKTSNPSSGEIQNLKLEGGGLVYLKLAQKLAEVTKGTIGRSGYSYIGVVVGATYPEEAKEVRKILPGNWFLVPGFGAQKAKAEDMGVFFDQNGLGALVASSRGIIFAYKNKENWKFIREDEMAESVMAAAVESRNQINAVRLK